MQRELLRLQEAERDDAKVDPLEGHRPLRAALREVEARADDAPLHLQRQRLRLPLQRPPERLGELAEQMGAEFDLDLNLLLGLEPPARRAEAEHRAVGVGRREVRLVHLK